MHTIGRSRRRAVDYDIVSDHTIHNPRVVKAARFKSIAVFIDVAVIAKKLYSPVRFGNPEVDSSIAAWRPFTGYWYTASYYSVESPVELVLVLRFYRS